MLRAHLRCWFYPGRMESVRCVSGSGLTYPRIPGKPSSAQNHLTIRPRTTTRESSGSASYLTLSKVQHRAPIEGTDFHMLQHLLPNCLNSPSLYTVPQVIDRINSGKNYFQIYAQGYGGCCPCFLGTFRMNMLHIPIVPENNDSCKFCQCVLISWADTFPRTCFSICLQLIWEGFWSFFHAYVAGVQTQISKWGGFVTMARVAPEKFQP